MNKRAFFEKNGYVTYSDANLNKSLLSNAKASVDKLLLKKYSEGIKPWSHFGDGKNELTRLTQIHLCDSIIFEAITQSKIGELAAEITGAKKIKIWGCQLFHKPFGTKNNGNVGFHRDSQHMPFFKRGAVTAWLPLSNITIDSGPLRIVKGSHSWPKTLKNTGGEIQNINYQLDKLKSYYCNYKWFEDSILLNLGGISFHDFDVLHGSYPNKSKLDRSVITIGLFTEDLELNHDVDDYGYSLILNDERFCPTIYEK